jgi:hypothetical protein
MAGVKKYACWERTSNRPQRTMGVGVFACDGGSADFSNQSINLSQLAKPPRGIRYTIPPTLPLAHLYLPALLASSACSLRIFLLPPGFGPVGATALPSFFPPFSFAARSLCSFGIGSYRSCSYSYACLNISLSRSSSFRPSSTVAPTPGPGVFVPLRSAGISNLENAPPGGISGPVWSVDAR